ncbi:hypothetical protein M8J76_007822 [Diaphorina citri]|jgi:hypothetical protein|nr:hypothetical protein M8J76_007822 [Diaphorina citri]KAI5730802.1 hypothetical protein M8J77_000149 [Diaphorina citri]
MKKLASGCQLGDQMENFLKIQLVIEVNDYGLQKRLLRNPELSLDWVIEHCRDAESAKQSCSVLQQNKSGVDQEVNAIHSNHSTSDQRYFSLPWLLN